MSNFSVRSAPAVRVGLIAALSAAVAVGAFDFVSSSGTPQAGSDSSTALSGEPTTVASGERVAPFTTADAGSCLTWQIAEDGEVSNFEQTSCESEHRFEVSARENLATYPSSEFGDDASMPDLTRQAQLREELCQAPTLRYLGGKFDPVGRFSIAPILPPAAAWEAGDRTMLCGIQTNDPNGTPLSTVGRVVDQDQARVNQPGECIFVDASRALRVVDCAEEHQLETTQIVSLRDIFPEHTPSAEEQDSYLSDVCTQAAIEFLGSEENLYQSTLQPYWGTLEQASWVGGSHSVNCSLVHANAEGGFSLLQGSAQAGREGFSIDGAPPTEQPQRNPLRENLANTPAPANPATP